MLYNQYCIVVHQADYYKSSCISLIKPCLQAIPDTQLLFADETHYFLMYVSKMIKLGTVYSLQYKLRTCMYTYIHIIY